MLWFSVEKKKKYAQRLLRLKEEWDELEYSVHPYKEPQFYHWLLRNNVEDMKTSIITSVRESAGLGSPLVAYTTNQNESMNCVAKAYTNYQQSNWVQLTDNMLDQVNTQSKEVEKAVYSMGEYRFKPAYKSLEVESSKWFMMSCDQCLKRCEVCSVHHWGRSFIERQQPAHVYLFPLKGRE